jgi:hypothetical protein
MPIPELCLAVADKILKVFCESRIPAEIRNKLKLTYNIKGNSIILTEERPYWKQEKQWTKSPIAKINYNNTNNNWTLYCRDRNQKWHKYSEIKPTVNIKEIINEINKDSTGIFWG